MTIDEAIKQIEYIVEDNQKVIDTHHISDELTIEEIFCDDTEIIEERLAAYKKRTDDFRQLAEWLKDYKRLLEQASCEDIMAIHTQGLDEEIRCTMCTNPMRSDKGCDGGCMFDEDMYEKVMDVIRNREVKE